MAWPLVAAMVGGSLISGILGSKSAQKSADAQTAANQASIAEQRRQYNQTRRDFAPWRRVGGEAINRLGQAAGGDMSGFYNSPGYDFVRSEGLRDIENRFSAGSGGGNAMKALAEFNSGLASQEYGNWWNRNQGLANSGQGATGSTAGYGAQAASNISNSLMATGRAQARGIEDRYGSWNNAIQGGLANYLYYDQLPKEPTIDEIHGNYPYYGAGG